MNELLNLSRLARRLGLTRKWLKAEADSGRLPCLKAGSRYVFDLEATQEALAKRVARDGMNEMIYLACPYSHDDPAIREERFLAVTKAAASLTNAGLLVYSPITHGHPMVAFGVQGDFEFWRQHARAMIERCGLVLVFCLDGHLSSVGVKEELLAAEELGKPQFYCTEENIQDQFWRTKLKYLVSEFDFSLFRGK
jgi:hypothetical protein